MDLTPLSRTTTTAVSNAVQPGWRNQAITLIDSQYQVYLDGRQGAEAARGFQKIVDHPGITIGDAFGALAHLGLARAYVVSGETARARGKYKDFLTLWKDADPDIPVLKQAKIEYAKLQ